MLPTTSLDISEAFETGDSKGIGVDLNAILLIDAVGFAETADASALTTSRLTDVGPGIAPPALHPIVMMLKSIAVIHIRMAILPVMLAENSTVGSA